jgi:hypothetical protein
MLTTTPFKIITDENAVQQPRTTQKSVKGGGGGLSVFHDSTAKGGHGSAVKSTRKALVDVTNSTFKAARAPQGGATAVKPQFVVDVGGKKPATVQFKLDERAPPTSSSVVTTADAPSSSGAVSVTATATSSSGGDDTVRAQIYGCFFFPHACVHVIPFRYPLPCTRAHTRTRTRPRPQTILVHKRHRCKRTRTWCARD